MSASDTIRSIAELATVGDEVDVASYEGFGGPAIVVDLRDSSGGRCKVRLLDGSQPDLWAHDFEIIGLRHPGGTYDSRPDTLRHVAVVQQLLSKVIDDLQDRRDVHDQSKLRSPEAEVFDEYTPKLAGSTYGSDEYRSFLAGMKPALDHHYAANSHHPEHYAEGVRGMSLADVFEMLVDWKAATKRHDDGCIRRSIEINQKRFGYSDELKQILLNTLPLIEG